MAKATTHDREWIQKFRLIDDEFMNLCFTDLRCVELVLRIILNKPDLVVESVKVQSLMKGPRRSIWLDIHARDGDGREYNIELQRDKRGADPRRARFHSAMVDVWSLKRRESFKKLKDNYVISLRRRTL